MKILIVNDDSITAPGISLLAEAAMTLGEVFKPYHHEYKLGIALRQIVRDYYPDKKTELHQQFRFFAFTAI